MPATKDELTTLTRAMGEHLLGELEHRVSALIDGPWTAVKDTMEDEAAELRRKNSHRAVDEPSELWLYFSSIILGAYRALSPLVSDARELREAMSGAMSNRFRNGIEGYLVDRFGITQDAPELAFRRISENFRRLGIEKFGKAYRYEQDRLDEDHCFVNVTRCFFNEFFRDNGAPELTSHFCLLDYIWADELGKPKYGVMFERPTTLAKGDDVCRFQFFRQRRGETSD